MNRLFVLFKKDILTAVLFFIVSLGIFSQGLSIHGLEYRDDEIFYFKSTQEMLHNQNYLSPTYFGENRFQKPIFFYWSVLLSYKIFGINWVGARWVAVLFAGMSVALTWMLARDLFNRRVATLSALILMTSVLFFRHAKNVVPDMPLNFFIVLAMYAFWQLRRQHAALAQMPTEEPSNGARAAALEGQANLSSGLFFCACALGFMVKGFAALIFPIVVFLGYCLLTRDGILLKRGRWARGLSIFLLICLPWFLYMIHRHGMAYLDYMLMDETKDRLVGTFSGTFVIEKIKSFIAHVFFYLKVLGSYFAPWSLFALGAIPFAFERCRRRTDHRELAFLLLWFMGVFLFFSFMYFTINHYMLVLSTPFAILVAYFFYYGISALPKGRTLSKGFIGFLVTVGTMAFMFISIVLAGNGAVWFYLILGIYGVLLTLLIRARQAQGPAFVLGVFMALVFSQSVLMARAGLTSHMVLQRFAQTVHETISGSKTVGVGSRDIHEKEFQAYFEDKVLKVASENAETHHQLLRDFFQAFPDALCLLTEKDFVSRLMNTSLEEFEVIQEEYIFRRRMYIDKGFFIALLRVDQLKIQDYLMEKIVLIQKMKEGV